VAAGVGLLAVSATAGADVAADRASRRAARGVRRRAKAIGGSSLSGTAGGRGF